MPSRLLIGSGSICWVFWRAVIGYDPRSRHAVAYHSGDHKYRVPSNFPMPDDLIKSPGRGTEKVRGIV